MESLGPLIAGDHAAVCALLHDAGLPSNDVRAQAMPAFLGVRLQGRVVGAIGLERYEGAGLLRSLVVVPDQRGLGLGARLVEALERRAQADGLARLVLLTESARSFFERRGDAVVARDQVPAEVLRSEQFRGLCPASATCLSKVLWPSDGDPPPRATDLLL